MKYNELQMSRNKQPKRVGRGIAAGQGKTAGRGTKGQGSRTGGGVRPGFEGGQNPLYKRMPKLRGFTNHWGKTETVYTGQINNVGGVIDGFSLFAAGLLSSPYVRVKVILGGEVTKKLSVKSYAISASALVAVQKAGGDWSKTERAQRQATAAEEK
jgi:large subunit ribosomal protein L15